MHMRTPICKIIILHLEVLIQYHLPHTNTNTIQSRNTRTVYISVVMVVCVRVWFENSGCPVFAPRLLVVLA